MSLKPESYKEMNYIKNVYDYYIMLGEDEKMALRELKLTKIICKLPPRYFDWKTWPMMSISRGNDLVYLITLPSVEIIHDTPLNVVYPVLIFSRYYIGYIQA